VLIAPEYSTPAWLLVRSKPKSERIVLTVMLGREIDAYCPLVLEPPTHRRSPRGPVPLFPGYVFVHATPASQFAAVHYATGVAGIVRFAGNLAAIDDSFVAMLREREAGQGHISVAAARRPFEPGMKVRVTDGPFRGLEGVVERYMPAKDRIRLLLMLVVGTRRVELEAARVRRAAVAPDR